MVTPQVACQSLVDCVPGWLLGSCDNDDADNVAALITAPTRQPTSAPTITHRAHQTTAHTRRRRLWTGCQLAPRQMPHRSVMLRCSTSDPSLPHFSKRSSSHLQRQSPSSLMPCVDKRSQRTRSNSVSTREAPFRRAEAEAESESGASFL